MKLSNGEIYGAREPLQKLFQLPFPVRTSYRLAQLANKLNPQFKIIEDVRVSLVQKYGKGEGNRRAIDPQDAESLDKFAEEFKEMLAEEVEVSFEPVKLPEKVASTCDKCHHNMDKAFEIEPAILVALEKFVVVD